MSSRVSRILLNPLFLLAVIGAAIFTGIQSPETAKRLAPIGGYYISLLKMMILPYLFVTITAGVARMVSAPEGKQYIKRIVLIYPTAMILAATVALACTFILPPGGKVDGAMMAALGSIVSSDEHGTNGIGIEVSISGRHEAAAGEHEPSLLDRFIPGNIFAALSEGDSLKTVIFCIVFGAALASTSGTGAGIGKLLDIFTVVQLACAQVIRWLNLILPFALFAMLAAQVASVGFAPLLSLGRFILVQAFSSTVLLTIAVLILSYRVRVSPLAALGKLSATIFMAFSTRSSISCIPLAVQEMTENLRFEQKGINLVLPLGITLCQFATVSYLLIGTIFITQVYGVDIDPLGYATIFFASIAVGLASSGATGATTVILISLVAEPMKLPVEAVIVMFIAVDPVIDAFRTILLVYGNCAIAALIVPRPALQDRAAAGQGGIARPTGAAARAGD